MIPWDVEGWAERVAICVIDGEVDEETAERIAWAEDVAAQRRWEEAQCDTP